MAKGDCTQIGPNCPPDGSALGYPPNTAASIFFLVIFFLSICVHVLLGVRSRAWIFMIVYTLGSTMEVIGYVGRILMHNNPYDLNTLVADLDPYTCVQKC